MVAQECGGLMEHPQIWYEDFQFIWADSAEEAEKKYDQINHCDYYHGAVLKKFD